MSTLTKEQYLLVLKRLREKIKNQIDEVEGYDCNIIGMKNTECNAGMCGADSDIYSKDMVLFPDQYPKRVAPKYAKEGMYCPLSKGQRTDGCFYDCLFFQNGLTNKKKILELYDKRIEELEKNKGGD